MYRQQFQFLFWGAFFELLMPDWIFYVKGLVTFFKILWNKQEYLEITHADVPQHWTPPISLVISSCMDVNKTARDDEETE